MITNPQTPPTGSDGLEELRTRLDKIVEHVDEIKEKILEATIQAREQRLIRSLLEQKVAYALCGGSNCGDDPVEDEWAIPASVLEKWLEGGEK